MIHKTVWETEKGTVCQIIINEDMPFSGSISLYCDDTIVAQANITNRHSEGYPYYCGGEAQPDIPIKKMRGKGFLFARWTGDTYLLSTDEKLDKLIKERVDRYENPRTPRKVHPYF